jgi:hypothetical protein
MKDNMNELGLVDYNLRLVDKSKTYLWKLKYFPQNLKMDFQTM